MAATVSMERTTTCFLDLPVEIRLKIYRYGLKFNNPIIILFKDAYTPYNVIGCRPLSSSLLSLCRTTYTEALPVLYKDNIFSFESEQRLEVFLETIGLGCHFLSHIRLLHAVLANTAIVTCFRLLRDATHIRRLEIKQLRNVKTFDTRHSPTLSAIAKRLWQVGYQFIQMLEASGKNWQDVLTFSDIKCDMRPLFYGQHLVATLVQMHPYTSSNIQIDLHCQLMCELHINNFLGKLSPPSQSKKSRTIKSPKNLGTMANLKLTRRTWAEEEPQ